MKGKHVEKYTEWTCYELTRVQEVGVLVAESFVRQEVVSISVERKERHHVVAIIVTNRGIGTWVDGPRRLMGPEPALKDAREEKQILSILNFCTFPSLLQFFLFLYQEMTDNKWECAILQH